MAERRYGFRFSFAEGGVIVFSMIGAAFLVFLFGVYAGRELEARKNAENTRTIRMNTVEKVSEASSEGTTGAPIKKEEKSNVSSVSPTTQEAAKTVVVITPPKQNSPPAKPPAPPLTASSPAPLLTSPEKESLGKTEILQKAPPVLVKKKESLPHATVPVVRERKLSTRKSVSVASPSEKPRTTRGSWSVQVHATRDENSARRVAGRLRSQGYVPVISKIVREGEVWYRVRVGSFRTADEARASVERFRREGKFPQAYPVSN